MSSDRDFIPAIKSLAVKGFRVINGYFPPQGMDLARECWGNFDLVPCLPALQRKRKIRSSFVQGENVDLMPTGGGDESYLVVPQKEPPSVGVSFFP
jgi:hypothetical protein